MTMSQHGTHILFTQAAKGKDMRALYQSRTGWKNLVLLLVMTSVLFLCGACSSEGGSSDQELQTLECGETADFEKVSVCVDNPIEPLVRITYESDAAFTEYEALLKVPVKIEANDKVKIKADDFGSKVIDDANDCLPDRLVLEGGDSFEGFLYVKWPHANMSGPKDYPEQVKCSNKACLAVWNINYEHKDKKLKSVQDIQKEMPGTDVTIQVTVDGFYSIDGSDDRTVLFECPKPYGGIYSRIPAEEVDEYKQYEGDPFTNREAKVITIKGTLTNLTTMTTGTESHESDKPYLDDVTVVK